MLNMDQHSSRDHGAGNEDTVICIFTCFSTSAANEHGRVGIYSADGGAQGEHSRKNGTSL